MQKDIESEVQRIHGQIAAAGGYTIGVLREALTKCCPDAGTYPCDCNTFRTPVTEEGLLTGFEFSDLTVLRDQARAWKEICAVLTEVMPGWEGLTMRGIDSAKEAIRRLATVKE